MINILKLFPVVWTLLYITSCVDGIINDDRDDIGPCEHTYKEPILNVTSVRNAANEQLIRFVKLRELKIDGILYPTFPVFHSSSVVASDSIFYCNPPFGIGSQAGTYEFIIEADGFIAKKIMIENVDYSISGGGCPSYNDGGKKVDIYLFPDVTQVR